MTDEVEIPFPEAKGEQPPPGTYRNVLIRRVTYMGVVTTDFKDKHDAPVKKPMIETELEFSIAGKPLIWTRQFTLTVSNKGSLFPLYLAATGVPPAVGGPGAKAMEHKYVDMGIKHEAGNNGGMWAKIEWATAPSGK
jgi:hypothetical protein